MFGHDRDDQLVVDVHLVVSQRCSATLSAPLGAAGTLVALGDLSATTSLRTSRSETGRRQWHCTDDRVNPVIRQADRAACPHSTNPSATAHGRFWGIAASSLASALGMPSMLPASMRAWRFQRNRVAWQMSVSVARLDTYNRGPTTRVQIGWTHSAVAVHGARCGVTP